MFNNNSNKSSSNLELASKKKGGGESIPAFLWCGRVSSRNICLLFFVSFCHSFSTRDFFFPPLFYSKKYSHSCSPFFEETEFVLKKLFISPLLLFTPTSLFFPPMVLFTANFLCFYPPKIFADFVFFPFF